MNAPQIVAAATHGQFQTQHFNQNQMIDNRGRPKRGQNKIFVNKHNHGDTLEIINCLISEKTCVCDISPKQIPDFESNKFACEPKKIFK